MHGRELARCRSHVRYWLKTRYDAERTSRTCIQISRKDCGLDRSPKSWVPSPIATSASKFSDPEHFPWTMGAATSYHNEGQIYANYILVQKPDARIAVLYQNDDYGKDYVSGLRDGLGEKTAAMIIKEVS